MARRNRRPGGRLRSILWWRRFHEQETKEGEDEPPGEGGRTWYQQSGYGEPVPEDEQSVEEEAGQAERHEHRQSGGR